VKLFAETVSTPTQAFKERPMHIRSPYWLLALSVAAPCAWAQATDAFAPAGAKAKLSVEFLYESVGKKQDKNDLREWGFKRSISLVADLVSQAPLALPTVQALDAAQTAKLDKQAGQMEKLQTDMAPMTADIGRIMSQCGENEACIAREVQKLGTAMAGTPKADAMLKSGKETARAVQPGPARYQPWLATVQSGSYVINEISLSVLADPACQPSLRCTRNEVRKGAGALQSRSATSKDGGLFCAVELDAVKNTLTVVPQGPPLPLAYTETVTTDQPARYQDVPVPKGPQPKQLPIREITCGNDKPFTVALKGGWRSQSGEQVFNVKDTGGKLTLRWRFQAQ